MAELIPADPALPMLVATPIAGVGKRFTLAELQTYVGGDIQILGTRDKRCLVVNENGKVHGLPVNPRATDLYMHGATDPVVGNALVLARREIG